MFLGKHKKTCLPMLGGCLGRLSPGQIILSASSPPRPHPAVPMCTPTRPARDMSGLWNRQIKWSSGEIFTQLNIRGQKKPHWKTHCMLYLSHVESKTRTYHGRFGSARRTAERRGAAGLDRTGPRRVGWPRSHLSLYPPRVSWTTVLNAPLLARTNGNPMETDGGTKPTVDNRFIRGFSAGPRALFVPGC